MPCHRRPLQRLAGLILILISLDFTNPFVGGAFTFESSEEALRDYGPPHPAPVQVARAPAPPQTDEKWIARQRLAPAPLRRARPQHSALALPRALAQPDSFVALSDDH